jgi:hypothetical protein
LETDDGKGRKVRERLDRSFGVSSKLGQTRRATRGAGSPSSNEKEPPDWRGQRTRMTETV